MRMSIPYCQTKLFQSGHPHNENPDEELANRAKHGDVHNVLKLMGGLLCAGPGTDTQGRQGSNHHGSSSGWYHATASDGLR